MNLTSLSWYYIKHRPLNSVLNMVILALGISIMVTLLLLSYQFENKLTKNAEGIDLVVGAKGSPMQLILCNIFHIDYPTGNIPLEEALKISRIPLVKKAIPMALGDSYAGYRIVGTDHSYPELYKSKLASGNLWKKLNEVSIGANVAQQLSLKVGDEFHGQHGMAEGGFEHDENPFKVSGIFTKNNTVIDNLILTDIECVWSMHNHEEDKETADHEHHNYNEKQEHGVQQVKGTSPQILTVSEMINAGPKMKTISDSTTRNYLEGKEITSLLIRYASPMGIMQMPRMVNSQSSMQAASPTFEITRLFSLLGVGVEALQGLAYLIIFISCLSIFIALFNALKERKYDLAIMRSMGATRIKLLTYILLEGIILTLAGGFLGLIIAHGGLEIFASLIDRKGQSGLSGFIFIAEEAGILGLCIFLGIFSALIPAINAYNTDISKVLAEG